MINESKTRVLLTGATGYVGGRLLSRLERQGWALRCLARAPETLRRRVGATTEVVRGDVLAPQTLGPAFDGIDVAFYLIHSMGDTGDFMAKELEAANSFAEAGYVSGRNQSQSRTCSSTCSPR